jgi:uncharacterized SAM-binding protein YcdF (DUF218 family)
MSGIRLLKSLFLPPSGCLLVALAGLALAASGRLVPGLGWTAAGVVGLALLSLPVVGRGLLAMLDRYPPLPISAQASEDRPGGDWTDGAHAIVILDGGGRQGAREYGGPTVKNQTLERLRYGAHLEQRTGLPVMVSGNGFGRRMGDVLTTDFGAPLKWCEQESRNTWENGRAAAAILLPEGVRKVILVTHFWHMPRAVKVFRSAGLEVVAAPMGFRGRFREALARPSAFLPGFRPMEEAYLFLHESVGLAWYRLRYGSRFRVGPKTPPGSPVA